MKPSKSLMTFVVVLSISFLATIIIASAEEGLASWYGPGFHGKPTSTGEIYNQHGPTCASRGHYTGAILKITNLSNGKWALCRVNDRGPFVKGRIIDVSLAVAEKLDMVDEGVVPVRIEVRR